MIHGYQEIDGTKHHLIVAPWSQGRCVNNAEKFYFLSKGSVDKGEDYKEAALRETHEETGIDVNAIAESKIVQRGEIDRMIINPIGLPQRMWACVIEMKDIDSLRAQLKNSDVQCSDAPLLAAFPPVIAERLSAQVRSANKPDFATLKARLLEFLQAKSCHPGLIEQVQQAESPDALGALRQKFCDEDKKQFDAAFGVLKKELQENGVIGDDSACLKLDGRIRPLSFYQEGADILTVSEYLTRIVKQAKAHHLYDLNMVGSAEVKRMHGVVSPSISNALNRQLAVLMPIVTEEDIQKTDLAWPDKVLLTQMYARHQREQPAGLGR